MSVVLDNEILVVLDNRSLNVTKIGNWSILLDIGISVRDIERIPGLVVQN